MLEEELVDLVPLDEELEDRTDIWWLRGDQVQGGGHRVAVWNDRKIGHRRQRADLHYLGDATGPVDVGLQDVGGAGLDEVPVAPARVLVLARGDGYADRPSDVGAAADLVGQVGLLDPGGAIRLKSLRHRNRVGHVPTHPGVEHYLDIVPDSVAEGSGKGFVPGHPFPALAGAVTEEPLRVAVAIRHKLLCAFRDPSGLYRVAECTGVGRDLLPGRPPKQ